MLLRSVATQKWRISRYFVQLLCCMVILASVFGASAQVRAAHAQAMTNPQVPMVTVTVVSRLVLWARPSTMSRVVAVLHRGRMFTVMGRGVSGRWLYGFTDMGTLGWTPSRGFLMLHPEVRLRMLAVFSRSGRLLMLPAMM